MLIVAAAKVVLALVIVMVCIKKTVVAGTCLAFSSGVHGFMFLL
jgi:hypothetical protein